MTPEQTTFDHRIQTSAVTPDTSADFVKNVFSEVPATYELVNHILTLGMDVAWRRRAAQLAAASRGGLWVDMCTGTGEMAVLLSRLAPDGTEVRGVDFSLAMLAEARRKPGAKRVGFIAADIAALPFQDQSADVITMSFATRNINLDREALGRRFAELHRVLKPGGCFINLETSQPPSAFVKRLFHLYVKLFVRQIGGRISGSRTAYAYLSSTIPRFYPAEVLSDILRQAGFGEVTFQRLLLGAAAIHRARR
ncbi:MAG: dimethylmenaquinone methyltransferase [Verrucomicrobia bacterium]|nr:dimethylmenaquinone methyltransferase [Verrucomicrobiota bacterium]